MKKSIKKLKPLDQELEALGFKAMAKPEIKSLLFKTPIASSKQKAALVQFKNILGVTQAQLATVLGCSARTIWSVLHEKGKYFKHSSHLRALNQLAGLFNDLLAIHEKDTLKDWLKTENQEFENKRPMDLLMDGKVETLIGWAYVKLEGEYE